MICVGRHAAWQRTHGLPHLPGVAEAQLQLASPGARGRGQVQSLLYILISDTTNSSGIFSCFWIDLLDQTKFFFLIISVKITNIYCKSLIFYIYFKRNVPCLFPHPLELIFYPFVKCKILCIQTYNCNESILSICILYTVYNVRIIALIST